MGKKIPHYIAYSALGMLSLSSAVQGGGFQIRLHSTPLIGTAYAGNAAIGGEVSAQDDNPANLAYITVSQIAASLTPVWPTIKFRTTAGVATRDAGASAVVPAGFFAWKPANQCWTIGLSFTSPFGLKTDYPVTSAIAGENMLSDLVTHRGALNVAYRVNQFLSIGMGAQLMYSDAELTRLLRPATLVTPAISSRIKGHGWGATGTMGLIVEPLPTTRIGLSYTFRNKTSVKGNFRTIPAGIVASTAAQTDITYPDFAHLSVYHELNKQWAAVASVIYTRWKSFKEIRVHLTGRPDYTVPYNWKNTFFVSLGGIYKPTAQWIVRAGVALDKTPVPSNALRTAAVPDADRTWLTWGAEYKISQKISLAFSYAHEFIRHAGLEKPTVRGSYRQHVDFVSLQIKYSF